MMSRTNLKKFSIYEFGLSFDNGMNPVSVMYKKDEEDIANSVIVVTYRDGKEIEIPVPLFTALHEALNEIDHYGFVFSNLEDGEQ